MYSYQRAYVDFFEDELVLNGYDWRVVLNKYLFQGKQPLINCMIAGCKICSRISIYRINKLIQWVIH